MKLSLLKLILPLMVLLRVPALFRYINRNTIAILTIHGVIDRRHSHCWLPLRPQLEVEKLDQLLSELLKRYKVVSLDTALAALQSGGRRKKPLLVLTIDDGYRNAVTYAAPVVKKYGLSFELYTATGNVQEQYPFWFDRLDFAIQAYIGPEKHRIFDCHFGQVELDFRSREEMARSYRVFRNALKEFSYSDDDMHRDIREITGQLESQSERTLSDVWPDDEWTGVLTLDEIRAERESTTISFQSHTVTHARLPFILENSVKEELEDSKAALEEWTGKPCRHFAYPNGDWNPECAKSVKLAGYESAVTTEPGLNRSGCDIYALKRFDVPPDFRIDQLMLKLSGAPMRGNPVGLVRRLISKLRVT